MAEENAMDCLERGTIYFGKSRIARVGKAIESALREITVLLKRPPAEAKLRRIDALNRAGLNAVTAQIAVLDQNGAIIVVNEAWS